MKMIRIRATEWTPRVGGPGLTYQECITNSLILTPMKNLGYQLHSCVYTHLGELTWNRRECLERAQRWRSRSCRRSGLPSSDSHWMQGYKIYILPGFWLFTRFGDSFICPSSQLIFLPFLETLDKCLIYYTICHTVLFKYAIQKCTYFCQCYIS